MIVAMATPPLALALVLAFFLLVIGISMALMVVSKTRRAVDRRRDRPHLERLAGLPAAVALDDIAPAAPRRGRARRVARDLVVDGTFALHGPARRRAIRWLERNGYVAEAVAAMERRGNGRRRAELALLLGRMGSRTAAHSLVAGLHDPRYLVRDACATALGRVATAQEVPELVDALTRRDIPRGIMSNALLQLGGDADPVLVRCLDSPDPGTRDIVARALGLRRATMAGPALVRLLSDPEPTVRREALLALAEIGAHTEVDVPAGLLVPLSVDPSPIVRSAAATSLGAIMGDDAADVLSALTYDEDFWVSHRAAESLCRLPSGGRLGWEIMARLDDSAAGGQARAACLEWLERTGKLEERFEELLARGDDGELLSSIVVLEDAGSRAWGDLLTPATAGEGVRA